MRLAGRIAVWIASGFAGLIVAAVLVSLALGWRPYTVLTGSMEPAIDTGDVVMAAPIAPIDARPGDVVTFPDPSRDGELVSHRVRRLSASDGMAHFVTRGDANDTAEHWDVPLNDRVGRVVVRLPKVGFVASWVAGGVPRLPIAILAIVMAIALFAGLWRSRGSGAAAPAG